MIYLNLIWKGLNKNVTVVKVTFDRIKTSCSGYFQVLKHKRIIKSLLTTLISIYETLIHVFFKAENNKQTKKILVWVLKRGSLSIITVNNNLVLHKRRKINTLKKQIHENEWYLISWCSLCIILKENSCMWRNSTY